MEGANSAEKACAIAGLAAHLGLRVMPFEELEQRPFDAAEWDPRAPKQMWIKISDTRRTDFVLRFRKGSRVRVFGSEGAVVVDTLCRCQSPSRSPRLTRITLSRVVPVCCPQ